MVDVRILACLACASTVLAGAAAAQSNTLVRADGFVAMASDIRAQQPGDVLSVLIVQSAEARNSAQNSVRRRSRVSGELNSGSVDEGVEFGLGGDFGRSGEVRRSESFVSQMSVTVERIGDRGDLWIHGTQQMVVNGETTIIEIRGRVRPADISAENQVLSTQIADAQISYFGRGFVSRSTRPGVINRLFGFLGLVG